jgi:hypothetical protein
MSSRPGIVTSDDLTPTEQSDTAAHRIGGLDPLIHDCEALPTGWQPDGAATPATRYARALAQDDLVSRIGALGDVEYLDN